VQYFPATGAERFSAFDPATLFEAAGQSGMVDPAIRPAWPRAKLCGTALTVECPPGDNLMLHQAVARATPGVIIVGNLGGYLRTGAWGEILTVAAKAKGVAGLVVDGAVRDISAIEELGFPIFSRGLAIGSCTKERFGTLGDPIELGGVPVKTGDVVVGDSDGVVVIPAERADEVYQLSLKRREREKQIIEQLGKGRTTLELLNLPVFSGRNGSGND
jgi:4-hydroxy-4-methyl-2-oxoglutarate aldolase